MRWPWQRRQLTEVWVVWAPDELDVIGVAATEGAGMSLAQDDMGVHTLTWSYSARTGRWTGRAVLPPGGPDHPGVYEYVVRPYEVWT